MTVSSVTSMRFAALGLAAMSTAFIAFDASAREPASRRAVLRQSDDVQPARRPLRYYRYLDQPNVYYGEDGSVTRSDDTPVAYEPTSLSGPDHVGRVFDPYADASGRRNLTGGQAMPARPVARAIEAEAKGYVVQVGAFAALENATRARVAANGAGAAVIRTATGPRGELHRVQLGPFATRAQADRARAEVVGLGFASAMIAREG